MTEKERQALKEKREARYFVLAYSVSYCLLQIAVAVMICLGVEAVWVIPTLILSHYLQIKCIMMGRRL